MNIEFLRSQGKVPDIFYYQLNGKSETENYMEQKQNFLDSLEDSEDADTV